jgi:CRISPR-associated protein Csy3
VKTTVKTASVLAFERKLDPSDALFFCGTWDSRHQSESWEPILIREKSVRGTISNRLKKTEMDPLKLDAKIESPNLQTVDVATLSPAFDTLKVRFTLRILPGVGEPYACNSEQYKARVLQEVGAYVKAQGLTELAKRYAYNLANGRFLWRNRIGAEQIEIQISQPHKQDRKTWTFDSMALSLRNFFVPPEYKSALEELTSAINSALTGETALLEVTAYLRLGKGQEVFPSQELILDKGKTRKSKTLYQVANIAAIHSQKIGNALRTIDTWYPGADDIGPIAVEPYGSVTSLGKAYRQPNAKVDFYTLLDNWMLDDKAPTVENQHFVIAVLIRGGVFGEKESSDG